MGAQAEVEIKFRVPDLRKLQKRLRALGFHLQHKRTHESNTLYDLPSRQLQKRGELLRLREYGEKWTVTHKAKGSAGRHKTRMETETVVADGKAIGSILHSLGFAPSFRYEKYRAEWSDGRGHVVIDETPIGNFAEIEGPAKWIDDTAKRLGVDETDYITQNYASLFFDWKKKSRSRAAEMTFAAVKKS